MPIDIYSVDLAVAIPMFHIGTWYKSLSMIRVAVKAIRKDKGLMSPFFLIKKVLQGIYPQLSTEIIQKV